MDDLSLGQDIQMGDLEELARINPVAWEQLLHIVDNRQNEKRIDGLEKQLRSLGKSSKNLVNLQKEQIERDAAHIEELEAYVDEADKGVVNAAVTKRLEAALSQHYPFYDEKHCPAS